MLFKVVTLLVALFFSGLLWLGWRQRDWKLGMVNFVGMALNIGVVILDFRAQFDIAAAMTAFLALIVVFTVDIFLLSQETRRPASAPIFDHGAPASARHQEQPRLALIISEQRLRRELAHGAKLAAQAFQQALRAWQEGNAALQRGNLDDAQKQYENLLRLAATPSGLNNLGAVLLMIARADTALEHLVRACQLDPELMEAWLNRGRALFALKRFAEALAAFDQAVALQPNMLEPWIFRANTLVQMGQNETAIQNYDAALGLNANRAECWNNRGVALSRMGKWPETVASFERALKIQSGHYPASLNRMLAVDRLGRFDLARQHYRNFLKQPSPAVNGNLVFIRSRLQQLEGNTPPRLDFPQLEFELAA